MAETIKNQFYRINSYKQIAEVGNKLFIYKIGNGYVVKIFFLM